MNKNNLSRIGFVGAVLTLLLLSVLKHESGSNTDSETSHSTLTKENPIEPYLIPTSGASPVSFRKPDSSGWAEVVPEMKVTAESGQAQDFKRTYRILNRTVPMEAARKLRLNYEKGKGLKDIQAILGLNKGDADLVYSRSYPGDVAGSSTTRLSVIRNGIPVFGSEIIVNHLPTKEGVKEEIVADVISEVSNSLETKPSIGETEAVKTSAVDALAAAGTGDLNTEKLSSKLVYYPTSKDLALAWQIRLKTEAYRNAEGLQAHGVWNYFIDAHSAEVLGKFNEVHTVDPQASGPGGNEKFNRPWTNELDVTVQGSGWLQKSSQLETYDAQMRTSGQVSLISGMDLANFGIRDGNNAHGYAEITLKFLSDLGYNSIDNKGKVIRSVVRYGVSFANAFWDGSQSIMVYGDGGNVFYNMASDIGVVAHEINHGFTESHSNLIYQDQSGGLNESFSDIAGVATSFASNQTGATLLIGDRVIRTGGFLRNMCDPKADGRSIDHVRNYIPGIDVHYSSGIPNKVFCRFARRLASGGDPAGLETRDSVKKAARVFFKANDTKWTMNSTFMMAATATKVAASELGFSATEQKFLVDSWADVGVTISLPTSIVKINNMKKSSVKLLTGGSQFACDSTTGICSKTAVNGEIVVFEIVPEDSIRVSSITGCDKRRQGICELAIDQDREVTPMFKTEVCPPRTMLKGGKCVRSGISSLKFE